MGAQILIELTCPRLCPQKWVDHKRPTKTMKYGNLLVFNDFFWICRLQETSKEVLMVPKAGLEPARISTVDFESTASTDFATSALKRYAENVVDYTCRTPPCKRQLARTSLSAEIFSIAYRDV